MVWKKQDASTWTDDFDGAEKVFYSMSQAFKQHNREHGSVYAICRIRSTGPADTGPLELGQKLRQAWTRLRRDFPALTVFEHGGKKTYLEPTVATVHRWARDTFWIDQEADAARNVATELHLRKLPCLVFVARSSEVLFHCSHWRIDALGTCMVLDRLFRIVDQTPDDAPTPGSSDVPPSWDLEPEHLSPSLEDAYGCAHTPTPATAAKAEAVRQRNFDTPHPSAGLSYHQGAADDAAATPPPRASRCQTVALGPAASARLVRACKARGVTVTAAVHAACAASVFDRAGASSDDACYYSTVVSANLRPLLPPGGAEHVCGTYVTGITHTLRRGDGFRSWCRQLTRGYRGDWEPRAYMEALRAIYAVHGEAMAALAASGARRPPASNVTVSSLGVLDGKYLHTDYGRVHVEAFHLGSAIMGRQPTLYIWTFGGCLTLSLDYNEAYYSADQMDALLGSIEGCLGKELGVETRAGGE